MLDNTTHYYPNALLIFLSSYQKDGKEPSSVVVSNIGDIKEVSSLRISLTVKASPGTLSATIINTGGKFHRLDDPEKEIPILYNYSNNKKSISVSSSANKLNTSTTSRGSNQSTKDYKLGAISTKDFTTVTKDTEGNFYQYSTYDNWKKSEYIILEDKTEGYRYPLYTNRNKNGTISEYWTYTIDGEIIVINTPSTINSVIDGSSITLKVGKSTKVFIVHRFTNEFFTDKYKDKDIQGTTTQYKKGRCRIEAMDRVVVYMSKRFTDDITNKVADLERVFTGVVNTVQDGYQGNEETIQIQAEDITKYMKISYINVNPALLLGQELDVNQTPDQKITVWTSILKGLSAPDIVRLMTLGNNYLLKKTANTKTIDGIGYYDVGGLSKIGRKVRFSPEDNSFVEVVGSGNRKKISWKQALGALFTTNTVHVTDPFKGNTDLKGFRPYELSLSASWSFYQGEWKTRREIVDRVAEDTHFVFYADRFGEIWFHPPRFDNSWIVGAENPKVYVIDTNSIISYGFVESDQNIYSSVYVSTDPDFAMEGLSDIGWYQKSFRDDGVLMKYGQRFFTASNPIINTKSNRDQSLIAYAKSLLQRLLAGKYQGQVTITGRAELDPGRPVYIPIINRVYYVETVDHELTFGNQFTTTLSLSYGRKPWEYLPELMTFSANDEVYMTDAAIYQQLEVLNSEQKKDVKNPK